MLMTKTSFPTTVHVKFVLLGQLPHFSYTCNTDICWCSMLWLKIQISCHEWLTGPWSPNIGKFEKIFFSKLVGKRFKKQTDACSNLAYNQTNSPDNDNEAE